ncbi:hypothetical protein OG352_07550 [Streptomyces sp. NBC_01485]|uniref:hypothetical protein n=1 Tax=Streptomyces sp. NBC_01485 TaxID=2903884 RepID=UPI002E30BA5A|nr:hypothetical protein [Streptomyces sp. NBC_01485]
MEAGQAGHGLTGWRLAAGGWRLAAGGWRLAAGGWRLAAGGPRDTPGRVPKGCATEWREGWEECVAPTGRRAMIVSTAGTSGGRRGGCQRLLGGCQ